MKEILLQYAAYNAWANGKLGDVIAKLQEAQLLQPVVSSFPGLKNTLMHMWDAESIWWQRLKLSENILRPSEQADYSTKEILVNLYKQDRQWLDWINEASAAAIDHEFIYHNTKREQFKQPVFQMLMHVFNHSTYHRGQLVTILRHLTVHEIPATDFIVWCRKGR